MILMLSVLTASAVQAAEVKSPDGKLVVSTSLSKEGTPLYSVTLDGKRIIEDTPLGIVTDFTDLSKGLVEKM